MVLEVQENIVIHTILTHASKISNYDIGIEILYTEIKAIVIPITENGWMDGWSF